MITVNICDPEVPPPGVGLVTVIVEVPADAISEALIVAVSCVEETNVVARAEPFQLTTDPEIKSLPLRTRVKSDPPEKVDVGEMEASTGTVLLAVNVWLLEVPPPGIGLVAVTG